MMLQFVSDCPGESWCGGDPVSNDPAYTDFCYRGFLHVSISVALRWRLVTLIGRYYKDLTRANR